MSSIYLRKIFQSWKSFNSIYRFLREAIRWMRNKYLKKYPLHCLDCTTHASNPYHMLHIKQFHWSQLARVQIPSLECVCTSCATTGKPILRPSHLNIQDEPLQFLELIQGDICVHPTIVWTILGIFMVFIDAST
jgi:hypothetical protein